VYLLEGGIDRWKAEGRLVTAEPTKIASCLFEVDFDERRVATLADMRRVVEEGSAAIADARPAGRFEATAPEAWPGRRGGHIPGSRSLPLDRLTDPETKTVLPADRLRALFEGAGIDLRKPVVTTCGSGVTACGLAFALHLLGHRDIAVYDGSWAEWGLPGDTPVETGPARP
jgi:thiosulfate/3-mercaptopyruvate sulfurtransferase